MLATIALQARERLLGRNRDIIADNLGLLDGFFAEHTELFEWAIPDGGCIAFPRYKGAEGVERFCKELVEQAGVLLLPASVYQSALTPVPADRFRIGTSVWRDGTRSVRNQLRHGRA